MQAWLESGQPLITPYKPQISDQHMEHNDTLVDLQQEIVQNPGRHFINMAVCSRPSGFPTGFEVLVCVCVCGGVCEGERMKRVRCVCVCVCVCVC